LSHYDDVHHIVLQSLNDTGLKKRSNSLIALFDDLSQSQPGKQWLIRAAPMLSAFTLSASCFCLWN